MSDLGKISAPKQAQRAASAIEHRQIAALEEAADALEGIRQDLSLLSNMMVQVVQGLSQLVHNTKQ